MSDNKFVEHLTEFKQLVAANQKHLAEYKTIIDHRDKQIEQQQRVIEYQQQQINELITLVSNQQRFIEILSGREMPGEVHLETEKERPIREVAKETIEEQKPAVVPKITPSDITTALGDTNPTTKEAHNILASLIREQRTKHFATTERKNYNMKESSAREIVTEVDVIHRALYNKPLDITNLDFLRDYDEIIGVVSGNKLNTQKKKIQAITTITNSLEGFEDVSKRYTDFVAQVKDQAEEKAKDNVLSGEEKKNFISWDELRQAHTKLENSKDKAIAAFYTLQPPRRVEDVSLIKIGNPDESKDSDTNYNYIYLESEEPKVVYNKYKTDQKYGQVSLPLPDDLVDVLKEYVRKNELNPGHFLFGVSPSKGYKNMSQTVTIVFRKAFPDKKLSVNMLRKIKISHALNKRPTHAEKEKLAKAMGHSKDIQQWYDRIVRNEPEENKK